GITYLLSPRPMIPSKKCIPCLLTSVYHLTGLYTGDLTTQTWTRARSPYRVTGKVTVLSGETLTIEPGVDVLFDADVQFHVRGRILALGAPLDSIRFLRGFASKWGGMRIVKADSSVFSYARFSDSHRRDASGKWEDTSGGALFVDSSAALTISNTVISKNIADGYGGGICIARTKVTLSECTIADNSAAEYGGGLSNNYATASLTMTNCLVVGNTSVKYGGAMENWGAKADIQRCVFFGNTATQSGGTSGGSMLISWGTNPTLTMRNSIVWGNTPTNAIRVDAGTVTATYSDVQGGYAGTGNISADPQFAGAAARDFRLAPGSPCTNTGDPSSPSDADGSRADMGIDWSSHRVLYGDVSGDGTISANDASLVVRRVVDNTVSLAVPLAGDVTGNGSLSAYDAALILRKVTDLTYRFPVERGSMKPAAPNSGARYIWFEASGGSWVLRIDNPSDVVAGDLVLSLPDDAPARVEGAAMVCTRQEGRTLFVSFARQDDASPVLISLPIGSVTPPVVARFLCNEGTITVRYGQPTSLALEQNFPNPFNPTTVVRFAIPEAGDVRLSIHAANGQLVRTLVDHPLPSGNHEVVWDGKDALGREVASGVYVCRLRTEQAEATRRMTLLR
ncbi:MAG TPA: FlgD immunoglobulin-like domain containing protein, partial [Candidatus Latescibacteria bacterium]|nr:FlgD immunoglobulin-like domain containing protein [Candidatus Latescibacterota bacterium]